MDLLGGLIDHGGKLQLALLFLAAVGGFSGSGLGLRRWVRGRLHPHEASRLDAERVDGQPACIDGILRIIADPCPRFDDGLPCAAASVSLSSPAPPGHRGPLPAHAHAGKLALDAGGESILLEGPVEVVAGTREVWPVVLPQWFPTALRDRLRKLVGPAGGRTVSFAPVCRSVEDGARVRVAGAWGRVGAEHEHYRDGAGWSLVPAAETRALRIAAHEAREVEGPHPLLGMLGALAFAALALGSLSSLGRVAMKLSEPDPLDSRALPPRMPWLMVALVTPSRTEALESAARGLDRRGRVDARAMSLILAAHEARGDCLAQGETLYAHGKLEEAADRWSRCGEGALPIGSALGGQTPDPGSLCLLQAAPPLLAANILDEMTEWERASDLAFTVPTVCLTEPRGLGLVLRLHLLAGHLDRASSVARGWGTRHLGPGHTLPEGVLDLGRDIDLLRTADSALPEAPSPALERLNAEELWSFALTSRGIDLTSVLQPPTAIDEALEEHAKILAPGGRADARTLHRLAVHDERMALYESLLGHHERARHYTTLLRDVDAMLLLHRAPHALPGGAIVRLIVEARAGNFQEAELLSWPLDDRRYRLLASFLAGRGGLESVLVPDSEGSRLCRWNYLSPSLDDVRALLATGDGAQVAPALGCLTSDHAHLLPLLAPRIRSHPEALLRASREVYREVRHRTLLDLLAEASDEVLLRQRLGLPDPQQKAQQRIDRIDRALRAPGVGALVRRLEGWHTPG